MKLTRHEAHCTVCKRPDRVEIEEKYVNWQSRIVLEREYGLPRDSVCRHAKALSLNDRRQSNLIGALETIIDRGLNTDSMSYQVAQLPEAGHNVQDDLKVIRKTLSRVLEEHPVARPERFKGHPLARFLRQEAPSIGS